MHNVSWIVSHECCNKFHMLSRCAKRENRLRFDKVTDGLNGNFLRHSVDSIMNISLKYHVVTLLAVIEPNLPVLLELD